jgi:AbrB family looped-hinge helix DNA binding protein
MKAVVTLSSKNQIAIPKSARKKLAIGPGDQLILDVEKDSLILKPKPKSYTKHLRGLRRLVWQGVDATPYIKKERETWEKKRNGCRIFSKIIQLATAIICGATAFLTNDRIFERFKEIDILILDRLLKS